MELTDKYRYKYRNN